MFKNKRKFNSMDNWKEYFEKFFCEEDKKKSSAGRKYDFVRKIAGNDKRSTNLVRLK